MTPYELKLAFRAIRKKSKRVLNRGDVVMVETLLFQGWSCEKIAGKVNLGHGERWK